MTEGDGGVVTACAHLFCRQCITDVLEKEAADDQGEDDPKAIKYKKDERPCPT